MRDSTKLRLCFAAMSNAGPEGAPTGPKSAKTQKDPEIKVENSDQDESSANQSKEAAKEPSAGENNAKGEESAEEASKETVPETKESSESEVPVSFDDVQNEVASAGVTAQPAEVGVIAPDAEIEVKEEDPVKVEEQPKEEEDAKAADDDAALSSAPSKGKKPDSEPQAKGPPQLSLNRIFLSFAANRKRLAIDAEAVKSVKIHRSEHWIEIRIDASRQVDQTARKKGEGYLVCRGTLLEKRAKGQVNYTAVTRSDIAAAWDRAQNDVKPSDAELTDNEHLELPPFFRLDESSTDLVLQVHLDPSAPLPEPAWLRKNDVNELFASLQRGSSAIAGQSDTAVSVGTAQHVWAGKIEVLDPDPPPSMSTFLYEWVKESFIGSQKERRTFVDELLGRKKKDKAEEPASARVEGEEEAVVDEKPIKVEQGEEESDAERDSRVARAFVEIVLRLIKGERVSLPPTTTTDGIFAQALTTTSYTSSMTYPGLFMLSLLDLSLHNDAADAAKVRAQVDKMLMEMPRATLVKAVDLTWKDVEVGRKGSNGTSGAAANSAPVMKGGGQLGPL
ncbi:hypothetical protein [Sporisorium scitamineum]|uniref:Uncharacterized protein n=1 Tax=Sporisorium scitamineum TaxID=49012 RepID=A0A0F7SD43_9BASI|nr:hypothetical protein [Sporisorium scitamineum]